MQRLLSALKEVCSKNKCEDPGVTILALTICFGDFYTGTVYISFKVSESPAGLRSSIKVWSYCKLVLRIEVGEKAVVL